MTKTLLVLGVLLGILVMAMGCVTVYQVLYSDGPPPPHLDMSQPADHPEERKLVFALAVIAAGFIIFGPCYNALFPPQKPEMPISFYYPDHDPGLYTDFNTPVGPSSSSGSSSSSSSSSRSSRSSSSGGTIHDHVTGKNYYHDGRQAP